ncbi:histone deacetylase complex subunit sap18 [Anaeramoeba ignava]|uniref:Histone deacetylase complex subunit sap18 n=1 Tax=Anaeramoeba ignava TaxID=1746090 RepID=A0A9Q0RG85_ANAIG|nr:histone deacetylase complex subunit sap18 [Anaeramoeba ignava]|eukprot:Anaeramoba_ignava/a8404_23.p1 GENE.a8404_23~~a8404_23.p1  ORF type:complete len:140 (+),score=25.89 a8404_23:229-648(+)
MSNRFPRRRRGDTYIKTQQVDRKSITPFLLRTFIRVGDRNSPKDYQESLPQDEIEIYSWKDCTLKELTSIIQDNCIPARKQGTRFVFAFVFKDKRTGQIVFKDIGSTYSSKSSSDDDSSLEQLRFRTGDYLDVALFLRD